MSLKWSLEKFPGESFGKEFNPRESEPFQKPLFG